MIFDDIFAEIGHLGRGQMLQYFLLCWPFVVAGFLSVDVVFLLAVPDFVCRPDNGTLTQLADIGITESEGALAQRLVDLLKWTGQWPIAQCLEWAPDLDLGPWLVAAAAGNVSRPDNVPELLTNHSCQGQYLYSQRDYGLTIPNEFNLVCNKAYHRANLKTIFFGGRFLGAILIGQGSDLMGRLLTFLIVVGCNVVVGIGLYLSTNVILVGFFLFLQGAIQVGYTLTIFVLGCEMVGIKKRKWTGTVMQLFYTGAFILIPLCYMGLRNWRHLALISGLPSLLFLSYYFIVHESPRWLLARGKVKKALSIIEMVAKRNGKSISEDLRNDILNHASSREYLMEKKKNYTVIDLLNTKKMLCLTINVCFNWIVNALIYYGIIFNAENLSGSLYLNFVVLGLVEIPAYGLNLLLLDRIGRRKLLVATLWATGVLCLTGSCIPRNYSIMVSVVAMLGKLTVTMSYGVVYFFTVELFPTSVRNVAIGTASMSARLGGMIAVPILSLRSFWRPLPMVVFFGLAVLAGALTFLIPETRGKNLDQDFDNPTKNRVDGIELKVNSSLHDNSSLESSGFVQEKQI